jgi:uncharacterized membrane protein YgdD (TMEM256/DUF423 family)
MSRRLQWLLRTGAAIAMLGVMLGAFGAHALKATLPGDMLAVYQTGVQYQLIHGLGIILIALIADRQPGWKRLQPAGWLMVAGVVLFSGSLYLLAVSGVRLLGAITPFGGVCFIAAWLLLALSPVTEASRP